jgi:GDP-4-dehydro-6-deoxy-D-mannose reductase
VRAFITGSRGFVGSWLIPHLRQSGDEVLEAAPDLDVTDGPAVHRALRGAEADAVYHLAALSHVGNSWETPEETVRVNALGTLAVLEAAWRCRRPPTVLVVSSAEVYGRVTPTDLPLTEEAALAPVTPYAASKVSAEYLGLQAHLGRGLPVIRARPFNHVGPGQGPGFVVSAIARRIAEAERDGGRTIQVGSLSARRDFTDVRDVVRAYRLLVCAGAPGGVYNVCSGHDVAVDEVARRLLGLAGADLDLVVDPALVRPADVPVVRGDATRLARATGWHPEIDLDTTLGEVLETWRSTLAPD